MHTYIICIVTLSLSIQQLAFFYLKRCSTVEPLNKGHFGSRAFALFSEVVLWWEVRANMHLIAPQDLMYRDSMY